MTGFLLALAALTSAVAFGGVQPLVFAPIQIAILIVAVVQFWRKGWPFISRPTAAVLGIVIAIPVLQLAPFPAPWLSAVSPKRVALAQELFSSLAPLGGRLALTVNSHESELAVLRLLCYALVFLLGFQLCQQGQQTSLIRLLIFLGILEAVYGCVQYLTGWQYILIYAKQYETDAATGTYINRNHFAGLLEMILPFVLARVLIRRRTHGAAEQSRWKQMVASPFSSHLLTDLIVFAVIAVGLLFSLSRMGIVAAIEGGVLVAAIAFFQVRRRSAVLMGLLVLALPLAYSVWIGLNPVIGRFEGMTSISALLEEDRIPIWRDTLVLVRDYPLFGTGLGTYPWSSLHYQTSRFNMRYEHAHNDYLEFAADLGIPAALVLFGSLWVLVAKLARKSLYFERTKDRILAAGCTGAMAALLAHEFTDFNLQIPANALIFSWIAGTAAALVRKPTDPFPDRTWHEIAIVSEDTAT